MSARTTVREVVDGIRGTLSTALGLERSMAHEELTDSPVDFPLLQVYWQRNETQPGGRTDRATFGAGVRVTSVEVIADLYVGPRSVFGEEMGRLSDLVDALTDRLETETSKPLFGVDGIKAFSWNAERATFMEGDGLDAVRYTGARVTISVRLF